MLREARFEAGITQTELARRAGVTQPMVAAYESGTREPTVATFRRLAWALGRRVSLAPLPGPNYPDPERASRIFLDLLDWVDHLPARSKPRGELGFPVLARR